MVDWYFEINEGAPSIFNSKEYLSRIESIFKDYINCYNSILSKEVDINICNLKLEDMNELFLKISRNIPIMEGCIDKNGFYIKYSKFVSLRLIDSTKEIYRDLKLIKILSL